MTYITTFDTTFFALWVYYALSVAAGAFVNHRQQQAYVKTGDNKNLFRLRCMNWTIDALWFVAFGAGWYFSLHGLVTFFAACTAISVVVAPCTYFVKQRRIQRKLLDDLSGHMIDTLPTPNIR